MKNYSPILRYSSYFLLAITLLLTACGGGSSSSGGGGSCAESLSLVVKNSQGAIIPSGGTYPVQNKHFFATVTVLPNPGAGVDVEKREAGSGDGVTIDRTDINGIASKLAILFGRFGIAGTVRPSGYVEKIIFTSSCISVEWTGTVK
ncbi:MAG: hypothetical protein ACN4GR_07850 [Arenicellales bacterium]